MDLADIFIEARFIEVDADGNLIIPKELLAELKLNPGDIAIVTTTTKGIFVEQKSKTPSFYFEP